jgi:SAM-dependent methyltransferase
MEAFSWSQMYNSRKIIKERFPSVWRLPIVKKILDVLRNIIKNDDKILDVGSCNRNLKKDLERRIKNVTYKSMDVDRENDHDYYSMHEIQETFDGVLMFECIEHLTLEEGLETLNEIYRVLKPGGFLIVSTPNTYHPNRYWECTHKVPFRYDELGGFIEICGFKTEKIYRIHNDQFFARLLRIYVMSYIHEYFDIDFAKSVLWVGHKVVKT